MDVMVTYVCTVTLVKSQFVGSLVCILEAAYFVQWAHLDFFLFSE